MVQAQMEMYPNGFEEGGADEEVGAIPTSINSEQNLPHSNPEESAAYDVDEDQEMLP
eukprot:CAMPEP_0185575632 /NCGR_PEP_ID=MMETSP0434-20130131/6774_1 /TAXON_ID=626734 ORGANISM="Favella taraikaensis, Strain Fe Narragansett Bay" /NCGR_SAMPLE_ID=MMETSP0434 /ASSEMBLY_ACC=CAM_ASM_000379 /LENGTH=56 /DNA_ID=CAMNT_0028192567 /DNA_START=219 /DNA_END=389 /DNA_ORIENTATION=+